MYITNIANYEWESSFGYLFMFEDTVIYFLIICNCNFVAFKKSNKIKLLKYE